MKKKKSIRAILRKPIEFYYEQGMISYRSLNVCRDCGIITVGDLILCQHRGTLRRLRNCGPYTESEFEAVMGLVDKKYALQLLQKLDSYKDLPKELKSIIVANYKRTLMEYSLECIRLFYDIFGDCKSFYDFFFCNQKDLAERFNNLKSWELKHYCYQMLAEIYSSFKKEELDDTYTYELVVTARAILWFCDEQFATELKEKDAELKMKRQALLTDFENRTDRLFRYSWEEDVKEKLTPTYTKALALFQLNDDELSSLWNSTESWRYSSRPLQLLVAELKQTLFWYESLSGDELSKTIVLNTFRYLKEEHAGFVADFYKQHGYYPMFFLLREYLMKTTDREEWVFAKASGIYDGHLMNFEEIGDEMNLGKNRVRQLFNRAPRYLFKGKGWQHYKLGTALVITEVDEMYRSVVEDEKVNIPFESFSMICTEGFYMKMVKVNGIRFLIDGHLLISEIIRVCKAIKAYNNQTKVEAESIPLADLLNNVGEYEKSYYLEALPIIIDKAFGLVVDEEGNIILPPQGVDVIYELTEILRKNGKPMSLKELYAALIEKRPEIKDKSFDNIRSKVLEADALKPIGMTTRYVLAEWDHVYRGTIRQLVADVLEEAKRPVHIDKIMKKVLKVYPNTNKKNVMASINSDKARFICFGDGLFGLMEKTYSKKYEAMKKAKRG